MVPDRTGRRISGDVADLGALLAGLKLTDRLSGGALRLDGRFDDRTEESPLSGRASLGRFVLRDVPLAVRMARDLSVYGWFQAAPSPQFVVNQVVAPFTLHDQLLVLTDAHANNPALGLTLRGPIDLGRSRFDLKGTVVPAWAINRLPGRLPLVGRLMSPENEGGVLAATLRLQGPFSDPQLHVNALSILAPGFLRRLFFE